jgi:hypothetical protein
MRNSLEDVWPPERYRLAPNDYLAALGQVTFVYNLLESMMLNIFVRCCPVADDFAKDLFHKLNNRDRMDLLKAFVAENEKHQNVRDAILHCVLCYDICTENRNVLMHSIYFNPNPKMTRLIKRSSRGVYGPPIMHWQYEGVRNAAVKFCDRVRQVASPGEPWLWWLK